MLSRSERVRLVDFTDGELPIAVQAELLGLNRSSLYYTPTGPSEREVALKHRIDEIYTALPFYGCRRIREQLRREGWSVDKDTVHRYMREMGLAAIYPGPNLSRRRHDHHVYPYLLRHRRAAAPNEVWGIDITYIRLTRGWMYLVAILDWYSRYVVSWELSLNLEVDFVLGTVGRAFETAAPEILNSDQGSQFTCPEYTSMVNTAGVRISMDGRGRALDNVFTERLWRSVKYEWVYLHECERPREVRTGLRWYFDLYNDERPHQALGYRTPREVHFASVPAP